MLSFVQNIFAPKANPIGVDFGSDTLRLAQVQRISEDPQSGSAEYKLLAAASADVPAAIRHDPAQRFKFFVQTARDLLRERPPVPRAQRLPLEGEQAMALEIAEGAVVAEHIEAIGGSLERPPGLVTAIGSLAHVRLEHLLALLRAELSREGEELIVGQA